MQVEPVKTKPWAWTLFAAVCLVIPLVGYALQG